MLHPPRYLHAGAESVVCSVAGTSGRYNMGISFWALLGVVSVGAVGLSVTI